MNELYRVYEVVSTAVHQMIPNLEDDLRENVNILKNGENKSGFCM